MLGCGVCWPFCRPERSRNADVRDCANLLGKARHNAGTWMRNGSRPQAGRRHLRAGKPRVRSPQAEATGRKPEEGRNAGAQSGRKRPQEHGKTVVFKPATFHGFRNGADSRMKSPYSGTVQRGRGVSAPKLHRLRSWRLIGHFRKTIRSWRFHIAAQKTFAGLPFNSVWSVSRDDS